MSLSGDVVDADLIAEEVAATMPPPEEGKKDLRRMRVKEVFRRLRERGYLTIDEDAGTVEILM